MTNKLQCMLLQVYGKTLLLPSSTIAEIKDYEKPEILEDLPPWLEGILNWRNIPIPVAQFEWMIPHFRPEQTQQKEKEKSPFLKIAVLNRIAKIPSEGNTKKYPFFSIILEGPPKLRALAPGDLRLVSETKTPDIRILMEAKLERDYVFIPNLNTLWEMIDNLPPRLQWTEK